MDNEGASQESLLQNDKIEYEFYDDRSEIY